MPEGDEGSDEGEGDGEHDDEGVAEALELGGEDEVDEEEGEDEGEEEAGGAFDEVFGASGEGGLEVVVEDLGGDAVHFGEALGDGLSAGKPGGDGGCDESVVAEELGGHGAFGGGDEVVEGDEFAFGVADVDVAEVGGLVAVCLVDFAEYLVLFAVHDEVSDALFAHGELEGLGDVLHGDAEDGCFVAVDVDGELGFGEFEIDVGDGEDVAAIDFFHESGKDAFEVVEVFRLDDVFDGESSAASAEGLLLGYHGAGAGEAAYLEGEVVGDFLLGAGAFFGFLQPEIDVGAVGVSAADHLDDAVLFGDFLLEVGTEFVGVAGHVGEGGAFGGCGVDSDVGAVLEGCHFGGNRRPEPPDGEPGGKEDEGRHPAVAHECLEGAAVGFDDAFEEGFGLAVEPVGGDVAGEEFGGYHGGEGEGDEGGDDDGAGDDDAEFAEEPSRGPLEEDDGEEYGDEGDGGGDDGEEYLVGALVSRLFGGHALFDFGVDVFHDDDGVIDDETDGEDDGEEGEDVDGEAGEVHDEECPDEGDGDGEDGDEGGAPVAEEEEDDEDDEDECFDDGVLDFVDGVADEDGVVEGDARLDVVGEVFFEVCHDAVGAIDDVDVVGAGLGYDDAGDHGDAVAFHDGTGVLGIDLGDADVTETDDFVAVLEDDEAVEVVDGHEAPEGADGEFGVVALDASGWQFDVFAVHCVTDVHGGDAVGREQGGVHAEAHGVALLAPDGDAADAGDGLEALLVVLVGVDAEVDEGAFVAAEEDSEDGLGVGVGFADGGGVDVARKAPEGAGDFVAHVVGGGFQIDVEVELDGDAAGAVAAGAGEGADALDAVDGGFQGLGDLGLDDVRVRAGEAGGNGDDGGIDAGIVAHAQKNDADATDQHHDDVHHGRQYGPIDACG